VADLSILMEVLEQGSSAAPESGTVRYYTRNLFRKVGEQAVFEWVIAKHGQQNFFVSNELRALALFLQATAPDMFERYREQLGWMIE
jgi:hypothetical protein